MRHRQSIHVEPNLVKGLLFMDCKKHTVFIIEDDKDIRETLAEYLQSEGFDVVQAINGKDALETLKSSPSPCLFLLDLFMPVMNGNQFLEIVKDDNSEHREVPVLVFSAAPQEEEEVKKVHKWVSGVLKKPFDIDEVLVSVSKNCR